MVLWDTWKSPFITFCKLGFLRANKSENRYYVTIHGERRLYQILVTWFMGSMEVPYVN